MSGKLVLVSGATGFIATHVVRELLEQGYRVRGTVRSLKAESKYQHLYSLTPDAKSRIELVEAELQNVECWKAAVKGCDFVLHVASPFPAQKPKDENDLIRPAVEGTLNVLKAAAEEKSIKRLVLTSSLAAVAECGGNAKAYNESKWSDPAKLGNLVYNKSKNLAERAAWDFYKTLPESSRYELCTVNPVIVLGPPLSGGGSSSVQIITRLLENNPPMCLPLNFPIVDVRDVAKAQVRCLQVDGAKNNRHILFNKSLWIKEISEILDSELKPQGYDLPLADMPPPMMAAAAESSPELKQAAEFSSLPILLDNTRFTKVLGVQPIDVKQTIIDTAYALIELGAVQKTPQYKGPNH